MVGVDPSGMQLPRMGDTREAAAHHQPTQAHGPWKLRSTTADTPPFGT